MSKNHRVSWKNRGKGKGCSERFVRLFQKNSEPCLYKFLGFLKRTAVMNLKSRPDTRWELGGVSHTHPTHHHRRKTRRNERGLDLLQLGKHFKDHFIINRPNRDSNKHLSIDLCRMTGLPKMPPKKPQNAPKSLNKVDATYYKMAPQKPQYLLHIHTYVRDVV